MVTVGRKFGETYRLNRKISSLSQRTRIFIAVVSMVILSVRCEDCERDKSRTVRKVVHQELVPIYKDLGVKIPYECPFFKERDRYLDNEDHKERESLNRWSCNYCGKAFIGEIYLDSHYDNRHADTIYKQKTGFLMTRLILSRHQTTTMALVRLSTCALLFAYAYSRRNKEKDSVCLADFCEIFRCDVISGAAAANFWDVALCMEEDMQDLTQDCQELLEACIPDKLSWNATNKLRSSLTGAVCSYLTCKKYWDTPVVPGEKEAPVAYTVFTVFLIVGMTIYYCVAVNYFLTDTFADMYDSDEIVARNPESLSNIEAHHNPIKKVKHRTRQKTFIDSEKFLSADRFKNTRRSAETNSDSSSRQRLESNRDRYSKRRHLETNDDMFNIRSSRDSPGVNGVDVIRHSENISIDNVSDIPVHHTDRGATADIGNTLNVDRDFDRSLDISVKEMDYR